MFPIPSSSVHFGTVWNCKNSYGITLAVQYLVSSALHAILTKILIYRMVWSPFDFFVATISSSNSNFQLAVSADNVLSQIFAQTFLPEIIKRFIIIPVPVFRSFQHSPNRCRHYIIKFFKLQEGIFHLTGCFGYKRKTGFWIFTLCLRYKRKTQTPALHRLFRV